MLASSGSESFAVPNRSRLRGQSWVGAGLLLLACTRSTPAGEATPPALGANAQAHAPGVPAPAIPAVKPSVAAVAWVDAVRVERWGDAARLIDALAADQQRAPDVRYVRARAALAVGDAARAVQLLEGLENELPLLASDVRAFRAEAQLEAGPHAAAALYFSQARETEGLIKAARAFERAGELGKAHAFADRALAALPRDAKTKKPKHVALEATARSVRASIAERQKQDALAALDLRWINQFAPTSSEAADLDQRLERVAPKRALTSRERYDRAWSMAQAGWVERTERELELAARAAGPPVSKAELARARAWVFYNARTDYAKASELFGEAARGGGPRAAEDLFYAARARSRAHDDEQAIKMYEGLAASNPRSGWAEHAIFLATRLRYILGRWDAAAAGYERYLARYGKNARFAESGRYEQAVAWLAAGKHERAAKAFAGLIAEKSEGSLEPRYLELEAVALAGAGKKDAAVARFRQVTTDYPLTLAALLARARLQALGQAPPPLIEPARTAAIAPPLQVELPPRAALLVKLGLDRDAERELLTREPELRKRFAPREHEALCLAYGHLATAAERYRVGRSALRPGALDSAPSASSRWLWECSYPRPYAALISEAQEQHKLSQEFLYAVMRQESAFKPGAVSTAEAVGLMQLIDPTARRAAAELALPYDPAHRVSPPQNIRLSSYYLKKLFDMFGSHFALAAAAYNAGPLAVSRWLETGETLPLDLWVARIPFAETRGYVHHVLGNHARYAYLAGGDAAVPQIELALPQGKRAPAEAY
jgi:soluble lytic murein transglycosylase